MANSRFSLSQPTIWLLLALAAVTVVVYAPVRHYEFVSVDDGTYVSENAAMAAGLSCSGVKWAFTTAHAANWHPLTWLSHMADVHLFGMDAGAHHVTNVVLHVLNTLLLFLILKAMTGRAGPSAFVAALFGMHPLHVESVAWVAERKDVLSTLFGLLAVAAYVKAAGPSTRPRNDGSLRAGPSTRPSNDGSLRASGSWVGWHVTVLVLFACGLMAKPMLVTLPVVLLLLDAWPLGRFRPARATAWPLLREKLPLFALSAASSVVTLFAQQRGGAVSTLTTIPITDRLANAIVACATYGWKTIWPSGLSVFYRYPETIPVWQVALSAAVIVLVSIVAARLSTSRPYVAVGWLWYLVTLAPVIGIVQIGRQAMADRYTYVPLIGLFISVTWGAADLVRRGPARRILLPAAAMVAIALAAVTARAQVLHWENSTRLWQHALAVDPDNYYAHNSLGPIASRAGRPEEAIHHFSEAIRIAPDYPEAYHNLGLMYARLGRTDAAIAEYRKALDLNPALGEARKNLDIALAARHNNLGVALAAKGSAAEAVASYREALRLQPDQADVRSNLGVALAAAGQPDAAVTECAEAVRLKPGDAALHYNLGFVLAGNGRTPEAISQFKEAVRLQPDLAAAHTSLALALAAQRNLADALPHFTEAARLQPQSDTARQYLGLALAGAGRFPEAIAQLNEAVRLNPGNATAAHALAEARRRAAAATSR